jgi:hypothetical protein
MYIDRHNTSVAIANVICCLLSSLVLSKVKGLQDATRFIALIECVATPLLLPIALVTRDSTVGTMTILCLSKIGVENFHVPRQPAFLWYGFVLSRLVHHAFMASIGTDLFLNHTEFPLEDTVWLILLESVVSYFRVRVILRITSGKGQDLAFLAVLIAYISHTAARKGSAILDDKMIWAFSGSFFSVITSMNTKFKTVDKLKRRNSYHWSQRVGQVADDVSKSPTTAEELPHELERV